MILFTLISVNIFSQFDCSGVPVQTINLCDPETEITLEDREGDCCEGTNCIIIQINLCPEECYEIKILGAPAHGAIDIYKGNCQEEVQLEEIIQINDTTVFLFCKPGNNPYTIVKIPVEPPVFPVFPDVIVNCSSAIPPVDIQNLLDNFGSDADSIHFISETSDQLNCNDTVRRKYKVFHKCGETLLTQKFIIKKYHGIIFPTDNEIEVSCINDIIPPVPPILNNNCRENTIPILISVDTFTNHCIDSIKWVYNYNYCDTVVDLIYTYIINFPNSLMLNDVTHTLNCISQAILENVEYPEVLDGCGNPILPSPAVVTDEPSPLSCNGQRTFTFNYVNCEGRSYIWKYIFVIQDNVPPTAIAPQNVKVSCNSEIPEVDISLITNVQDNCGSAQVKWINDVSDGASCPEKITRTYTVTDNCGNTLVLTQQIIVSDNIPPTASDLPTINVSSLSDVPTPNPSDVVDESDNCGVASVVWSNDSEEMAGCKIISRTYTITDYCGNSSDVQQIINVCSTDQVFHVPNTFTPDGNEFNNTFYPVFSSGFVPKEYEFFIFDRWGELIFQSNNLQVGWDGTYGTEGKKCQDGTYTWKIQFNFKENAAKTQETGHVNLLR